MIGFISKFVKRLTGEESHNNKNKQAEDVKDNPIDHSHQLVNAIVTYLRKHKNLNGIPVIWAANDFYYSIISSEKFESFLRAEMANRGLQSLSTGKIECKHAVPHEDDWAKEIYNGLVFMSIVPLVQSKGNGGRVRAKITVWNGHGSLEEDEYILDSDIKKKYNLGREKLVSRNGINRINDIVVASPEKNERNGFVSRVHASVVYSKGHFILMADEGGCTSTGGRKTRVIKNSDNSIKELITTTSGVPLDNGDIIELGKEEGMKLIYKIID